MDVEEQGPASPSGSSAEDDSDSDSVLGDQVYFQSKREANRFLYRDVESQMQNPVRLTLTAKSCIINQVPDWASKFVKLPDPIIPKKEIASTSTSTGETDEAETGRRKSKRLRREDPAPASSEGKWKDDDPLLNVGKMGAYRSKVVDEAIVRAWKRGAEILPNEELQRWVRLVKEEMLMTGKVNERRLEIEALHAIGELYEELREHMGETKVVVAKRGSKGAPLFIKMTWPGPVHDSFVTDNLVGEEVRRELVVEAKRLEGVDNPVTWHPNTNKTVYNIIHPSLWPLVNREERKTPVHRQPYEPVSPEEVEKIPKGQRDYSCLFHLPAMAKTEMEPEQIDVHLRRQVLLAHYLTDEEFQWIPSNVWVDAEGRAHFLSYINGLNPLVNGGLYQLLEGVLTEMLPMFEDCMNSTSRRNQLRIDFSLRSKQIQVYPRMGSVLLSPDKPAYQGGMKHAEGFDNERIIAIGVYYYSVENITQSELTVHCTTGKYIKKNNRDHHDMRQISINCAQGRCVVLPNCEHNMKPFQLEDATRAGHRRSLVFFLVDPADKVVSTASVPVQQKEWVAGFQGVDLFPQLPSLVVDRIADFTGYGLLLSEQDAVSWQEKMNARRMATIERASEVWGNFRPGRRYD